MASGGPRPGSGRKPGSVAKAVVIPPSSRKIVQDALIERIKDVELTPIDVMVRGMKLHYDDSRIAMAKIDDVEGEDIKEQLKRTAKEEIAASMLYAKELAPYIHQKLQSVTLKGDKDNPLEVALGFSTADDLRKLVRGS